MNSIREESWKADYVCWRKREIGLFYETCQLLLPKPGQLGTPDKQWISLVMPIGCQVWTFCLGTNIFWLMFWFIKESKTNNNVWNKATLLSLKNLLDKEGVKIEYRPVILRCPRDKIDGFWGVYRTNSVIFVKSSIKWSLKKCPLQVRTAEKFVLRSLEAMLSIALPSWKYNLKTLKSSEEHRQLTRLQQAECHSS